MTTSAPHAKIMTMQHTCAGHQSRHPNGVLQSVCIVAVQSTAHHNVAIGHGITGNNPILLQKPSGTRNFNVPIAKFWEMQASSHQMLNKGPVNCIPTGHTAKLWEVPALTDQTIMLILSFLGETRTTMVTREGIHQQVLADTPLESSNSINLLIILVQISGIMGTSQEDQHSPTPGLTRYNQQYSPPIYPPTPSLNSSFPEALSKSLLQIAENQSRTIEAMKASQEAQAEAYKEMSRTNKMRDDDALFNSIKVYDGSNPAKFEKWIDSINQATHITGRDLRKELLKKSDGVIRNSLAMIDATWSNDNIIAKLCQDFSSLSTMNKAREELKSLYQEPREPITAFIYKYGHMHFLSTGIKAERETQPFAITEFISALEPQLNRAAAKRYTDTRNKPHTLEEVFQLAEQCSKKCRRPIHWVIPPH